jgi:uncharacterized coiled-coil protein SlyX
MLCADTKAYAMSLEARVAKQQQQLAEQQQQLAQLRAVLAQQEQP